ncbi:hypothetical protein BU23DRAFT_527071 [Bimuria novae-zelandiae CBS 107.79]|uniref:Uncharacterized protein n=1 Tax=Bimuria novae-zelandiae CBS 107.79 TaxID=1447943 RepID=A0A6A5VK27_9PLEO|nr:hypothetical protein BU23DRAFT_527071 [Bimuria novae-zelandiae CBS 107.79]
MATPNAQSDMAQLFDFGEASNTVGTIGSPEVSRPASRATKHRVGCPAHGQEGDEGCVCSEFNQDVAPPDAIQDDIEIAEEEEFNTDFSSWLPRYQKPAHPCEYCRSKSLECFIYDAGNGNSSGCSPCNALFRPCSFSNPEKMPMLMKRTALDTLHSVAEVSERTFGGFTGKKPMRSLGHQGPIEEDENEDKMPKKGAAAARFPRAAVKILKDWLIAHMDHPYPSEEEKETLAQQAGLTLNQISNWMANTRRRQKARPKRSSSPSIRPVTEPVNIPPGRTWESLDPFERWKHSPPENEPAPLQAIARNVETFDFPDDAERSAASANGRRQDSDPSTGSHSFFRPPSITSLETGLTMLSSGSLGSSTSATFSQSSRHSLGSFSSLKSKERRRRRRVPTRAPKYNAENDTRLFQCTFCTDRFKSKYDWTRHEKSLHLSLEKWICAPIGDVITCSSSGQRKCVYCDHLNPSNAHLESHNHRACEEKGMEARTFYRKDHLRQHLRLMHGCKMTPSMDAWKSEAQVINSRCGFCAKTFTKWQERADHLAKEFRNGATMKDWRGCRGLDLHVAQHVTNAMPPYLIANESKSPFPFSATNSASLKQSCMNLEQSDLEVSLPNWPDNTNNAQVDGSTSADNSTRNNSSHIASPNRSPHPYATCWEILTLRLGRFAREHIKQHGPGSVTDAMLQSEARRILYDADDPWEQTAADNPEWLNLFRKAHGLDLTQPQAIANEYAHHDVMEDLGLGHNAQLDESFNLNHFGCISKSFNDPVARARAFECSLAGSVAISNASEVAVSSTHAPGLTASATTSGASNLPITTFAAFPGLHATMGDSEGTGAGGFCIGADGELHATTAPASKGLNSFIPPINEMACNISENLFASGYDFPAFSAADFDMAATTAAFGANFPATSSAFDDLSLSGFGTTMDTAQAAAWDDGDFTFNMDMDLDLDLGMGGTSGA